MGKPKGKTTAYAFFVRQQKEMFDSENPEGKIVFGEFMKGCGEKWRALEEDEKMPFQEKAAEDAERWNREMQDYEPEEENGQKKKKRKKDPNAPKRPKTAFFLFSDDNREEAKSKLPEGARVGEVAKELGKMWAECPDDKKAEYQEVSNKNKAKYELAMQEYNMNKEEEQY